MSCWRQASQRPSPRVLSQCKLRLNPRSASTACDSFRVSFMDLARFCLSSNPSSPHVVSGEPGICRFLFRHAGRDSEIVSERYASECDSDNSSQMLDSPIVLTLNHV